MNKSIKKIIVIFTSFLMLAVFLSACKPSANESSSDSNKSSSTTTESSKSTEKGDEDMDKLLGKGYDHKNDSFYDKKELYITWLNVWNGSSEFWWNGLASTTSIQGIKVLVEDDYVPFDSMKNKHRTAMVKEAKEAGIDAIVMDLTNGHSSWAASSQHYLQLAYENEMKFAVGTHPTGAENLEEIAKYTWNKFAKPGTALYSPGYLYKNDKPLMVLYCNPTEFENSVAAKTEFAAKFEYVWASGENSKADKWGWQIEPIVGPMLSNDSMYVTPSISWNTPNVSSGAWRSSLAMLDFTFLARGEMKPNYTIVSSMDDIFERNGWLIADTTNAFYQSPLSSNPKENQFRGEGLQMRDIYGDVSFDAYYKRVTSWISGEAKAYNSKGILPDGAHTVAGVSSGMKFGVNRPAPRNDNDIKSEFLQNLYLETDMESYYWFYHLGDNEYRIIKLTSGLSLMQSEGKLIQDWSANIDDQKWIVSKKTNGSYNIVNKKTGNMLVDSSGEQEPLGFSSKSDNKNAEWVVKAVRGRTMN